MRAVVGALPLEALDLERAHFGRMEKLVHALKKQGEKGEIFDCRNITSCPGYSLLKSIGTCCLAPVRSGSALDGSDVVRYCCWADAYRNGGLPSFLPVSHFPSFFYSRKVLSPILEPQVAVYPFRRWERTESITRGWRETCVFQSPFNRFFLEWCTNEMSLRHDYCSLQFIILEGTNHLWFWDF